MHSACFQSFQEVSILLNNNFGLSDLFEYETLKSKNDYSHTAAQYNTETAGGTQLLFLLCRWKSRWWWDQLQQTFYFLFYSFLFQSWWESSQKRFVIFKHGEFETLWLHIFKIHTRIFKNCFLFWIYAELIEEFIKCLLWFLIMRNSIIFVADKLFYWYIFSFIASAID